MNLSTRDVTKDTTNVTFGFEAKLESECKRKLIKIFLNDSILKIPEKRCDVTFWDAVI